MILFVSTQKHKQTVSAVEIIGGGQLNGTPRGIWGYGMSLEGQLFMRNRLKASERARTALFYEFLKN